MISVKDKSTKLKRAKKSWTVIMKKCNVNVNQWNGRRSDRASSGAGGFLELHLLERET